MASKLPDVAEVFSDLVRCETRLYNAVGERLQEEHGLTTAQFEFLRHLRRHPGARVADLAGVFAIGVGAVSKGVDRLERRGWVARQSNPDDRRSSILALTPTGQRLVDGAEETFARRLHELIGGAVDGPGAAALATALAALRATLERDRVGLPAG
ncbi:MarR family winged helix-turn-helix transcriptional regulator [Tsukamurella soli]|uniref:MarR family winged helix-turn-helix transcriptional regulator n=1 Tax=Tsukamurella soli TaxID=644556 RepID=A0ABP8J7D4_9ACTN